MTFFFFSKNILFLRDLPDRDKTLEFEGQVINFRTVISEARHELL